MTQDPKRLEPCPFCGGIMEEVTDEDGHYFVHPGRMGMKRADCWLSDAWVSDELTGEGSIGEWNTRTASERPAATGERETLIARADKYLNTGSGEYAGDILRDMAEFIRRSPTTAPAGDGIREALENCLGCVTAAESEGLHEIVEELRGFSEQTDRLIDLVERRLMWVRNYAEPALAALPQETKP